MSGVETAYKSSAVDVPDCNDLVMEELQQVYYIAARIHERLPQQVELEDLVNAGVVGLIEASRSFDVSKNIHFKAFARFRIRGAIMDSLRESDWGSRLVRRRGREIAEATSSLEGRFGRQPTQLEIADELHMDVARLQKTLAQLDGLRVAGQQAAVANDRGEMFDLIESAPSLDDPDAFDLCLEGEMKTHLAEAVAKLSEREQLILSLYYREELTMKEIAEVVGVALSRVSQIRQSILKKLRDSLAHVNERPQAASIAAAGSAISPVVGGWQHV